MRRLTLISVTVLSLLSAAFISAQTLALSVEEQREFLLKAKITASRPAGKGVTGTLRLTLSDGRLVHDASFQSVDQHAMGNDPVARRVGELIFVDSYKYNLAAYEIARLVGLDHMMPVTVERRVNGNLGSLSWWVDDYLMDEFERETKGVTPKDVGRWAQGRQRMFVFAELVADSDRNKGNVIYTTAWDVVMIDFSRAFRLHKNVRRPEWLERCDRRLFERLPTLTEAELKEAAGRYLTSPEIDALLARRDRIVEHYQRLIRESGESKILY